jgi:predicted O-methyltransferase YrrM
MNEQELLNYIIHKTCTGTSDSDQHLMTLFSLILNIKAKKVLELGVRFGDTTLPLLLGLSKNGGHLTSIDINDTEFVCPENLKQYWTFHKIDAIEFLEKQTEKYDLIYVDDWHSYLHVKKELELIDKISDKTTLIVLHDLMGGGNHPNYVFMDGCPEWEGGGPCRAVFELDINKWEWATIPVNHGLTILRKKI